MRKTVAAYASPIVQTWSTRTNQPHQQAVGSVAVRVQGVRVYVMVFARDYHYIIGPRHELFHFTTLLDGNTASHFTFPFLSNIAVFHSQSLILAFSHGCSCVHFRLICTTFVIVFLVVCAVWFFCPPLHCCHGGERCVRHGGPFADEIVHCVQAGVGCGCRAGRRSLYCVQRNSQSLWDRCWWSRVQKHMHLWNLQQCSYQSCQHHRW